VPRSRTHRLPLVAAAVVAAGTGLLALPAVADTPVPRPDTFTSAFTVAAVPGEVVGPDGATGQAGASGTFSLQLNSDLDVLCYDVQLSGVSGPYASPARTATHVHEGPRGQSGPPRIVLVDPQPVGAPQARSRGCLKGPFTTGVTADGADTGAGFRVADLEARPGDFYVDVHGASSMPGAVRGQLRAVPVGGVAAGLGGADRAPLLPAPVALATGLVVLAAGAVLSAARRPVLARARR